jgi:hypothetical protein
MQLRVIDRKQTPKNGKMTHYDTFAGRLRNPLFDWSNPNELLTSEDIEFLTESFLDPDAFRYVSQRALEGGAFRKLDWGSWVVPVTKGEILSTMAKWAAGWDLPEPGDHSHKPRLQRARCKTTVEALPLDQPYVLVIQEF